MGELNELTFGKKRNDSQFVSTKQYYLTNVSLCGGGEAGCAHQGPCTVALQPECSALCSPAEGTDAPLGASTGFEALRKNE